MAEPLSLQHTAQLVCIRTLLDLTHGKDIREYLKLAYHSAVTEDLLNVFVRFYPKLLTDDILAGLISPHIQNLIRLVRCFKIKPSKFIRIFSQYDWWLNWRMLESNDEFVCPPVKYRTSSRLHQNSLLHLQ
ncbi:uncharacterized protein LOC111112677 [Crassostrea virginica]